ncbi:hypothetical protein B0H16DRAFT_1883680 [Mycena metata]|uniref:Uncharacterized protein n=1 Tax=Mycena metata TaxID=1033252 RepID=A0AAD7JJ45_9AGAR|nr:hypothetical protein B0H16DRAFT_1883680 [Mycena metata]
MILRFSCLRSAQRLDLGPPLLHQDHNLHSLGLAPHPPPTWLNRLHTGWIPARNLYSAAGIECHGNGACLPSSHVLNLTFYHAICPLRAPAGQIRWRLRPPSLRARCRAPSPCQLSLLPLYFTPPHTPYASISPIDHCLSPTAFPPDTPPPARRSALPARVFRDMSLSINRP